MERGTDLLSCNAVLTWISLGGLLMTWMFPLGDADSGYNLSAVLAVFMAGAAPACPQFVSRVPRGSQLYVRHTATLLFCHNAQDVKVLLWAAAAPSTTALSLISRVVPFICVVPSLLLLLSAYLTDCCDNSGLCAPVGEEEAVGVSFRTVDWCRLMSFRGVCGGAGIAVCVAGQAVAWRMGARAVSARQLMMPPPDLTHGDWCLAAACVVHAVGLAFNDRGSLDFAFTLEAALFVLYTPVGGAVYTTPAWIIAGGLGINVAAVLFPTAWQCLKCRRSETTETDVEAVLVDTSATRTVPPAMPPPARGVLLLQALCVLACAAAAAVAFSEGGDVSNDPMHMPMVTDVRWRNTVACFAVAASALNIAGSLAREAGLYVVSALWTWIVITDSFCIWQAVSPRAGPRVSAAFVALTSIPLFSFAVGMHSGLESVLRRRSFDEYLVKAGPLRTATWDFLLMGGLGVLMYFMEIESPMMGMMFHAAASMLWMGLCMFYGPVARGLEDLSRLSFFMMANMLVAQQTWMLSTKSSFGGSFAMFLMFVIAAWMTARHGNPEGCSPAPQYRSIEGTWAVLSW